MSDNTGDQFNTEEQHSQHSQESQQVLSLLEQWETLTSTDFYTAQTWEIFQQEHPAVYNFFTTQNISPTLFANSTTDIVTQIQNSMELIGDKLMILTFWKYLQRRQEEEVNAARLEFIQAETDLINHKMSLEREHAAQMTELNSTLPTTTTVANDINAQTQHYHNHVHKNTERVSIQEPVVTSTTTTQFVPPQKISEALPVPLLPVQYSSVPDNHSSRIVKSLLEKPEQQSHNESTIEFLLRFTAYVHRNRITTSEWFDLLCFTVLPHHVYNLEAHFTELAELTWDQAQRRVFLIMDPSLVGWKINNMLTTTKPKYNESMLTYQQRFRILGTLSTFDEPTMAEIFLDSLPTDITNTIRTSNIDSSTFLFKPFRTLQEAFTASRCGRAIDIGSTCYTSKGLMPLHYNNRNLQQPGSKQTLYCELHGRCYHTTEQCETLQRRNNTTTRTTTPQQGYSPTPTTTNAPTAPTATKVTVTATNGPPMRTIPVRTKSTNTLLCTTCNGTTHTAERCWITHPELAPAWMQRKQQSQTSDNRSIDSDIPLLVCSDTFTNHLESRAADDEAIEDVTNSDLDSEFITRSDFRTTFVTLPFPQAEVELNGVKFTGDLDSCARNCFMTTAALSTIDSSKYTFSDQKITMISITDDERLCKTIMFQVKYKDHPLFTWPFAIYESKKPLVTFGYDFINFNRIAVPLRPEEEIKRMFAHVQLRTLDNILHDDSNVVRSTTVFHPDSVTLMLQIQDAIDRNLNTINTPCTLPPIELSFTNPTDRAIGVWTRQRTMTSVDFNHFVLNVLPQWIADNVVVEFNRNDPPCTDPTTNVQNGNFNNVVFCVHQNGAPRYVTDFKPLNMKLRPGTNEVPGVNDAIIFMARVAAKIMSKIDIKKAFLQMLLRASDRPLTAFTINGKSYMFTRGQLGLHQMPSDFERLITAQLAIHGCTEYTWIHIDDLWIGSSSISQHILHLITVINALTDVCLTINIDKSEFFVLQTVYLGRIVSIDGVKPYVKKICNMLDWNRPVTRTALRRYLGIINYFRIFLHNCTELFQPFLQLQGDKWDWTPELEETYVCIFHKLVTEQPHLWFPLPHLPLHLATDASKYGIGGALFQLVDDKPRFIALHSRVLSPAERNYTIPKKELLSAIVHVNYWRYYLYKVKFTLYLDNQGITFAIRSLQDPTANPTINWWLVTLSEYNYDVVHLPGADNDLPDLCSRVQEISESSSSDSNTIATVSEINTVNTEQEYTDEEIQAILEKAHSIGHFGAEIMYKHITVTLEITSIPYLLSLCKQYTSKCSQCQRINDYRVGYSPLHAPEDLTPFEYLHCDILDLPITPQGNRYLYNFVDSFTRMVFLFPSVEKSAAQTATFLLNVCSNFGFPKRIKTDGGGEFTAEVVQEFEKFASITHHTILPYNHQANGIVERTNRTARQTLFKNALQLNNSVRDWDLVVGVTQLELNMRVHPQTLSAPFSIMFGRQAIQGERSRGLTNTTKQEIRKFLQNWKQYWSTHYRFIVPHIIDMKHRYFTKHKYHHFTTVFNIGDSVMYKIPNRTSKAVPPFKGPYTITDVKPNGIYTISRQGEEFDAPTNFLKRVSVDSSNAITDLEVHPDRDQNDISEVGEDDHRDRTYDPVITEQNEVEVSSDETIDETPLKPRKKKKATPKKKVTDSVPTTHNTITPIRSRLARREKAAKRKAEKQEGSVTESLNPAIVKSTTQPKDRKDQGRTSPNDKYAGSSV